jgi:hypothetical protein
MSMSQLILTLTRGGKGKASHFGRSRRVGIQTPTAKLQKMHWEFKLPHPIKFNYIITFNWEDDNVVLVNDDDDDDDGDDDGVQNSRTTPYAVRSGIEQIGPIFTTFSAHKDDIVNKVWQNEG